MGATADEFDYCTNFKSSKEVWLPLTDLSQLNTGAKDYTLRPRVTHSQPAGPQSVDAQVASQSTTPIVNRHWAEVFTGIKDLLAEHSPAASRAQPLDSKERLAAITSALDAYIDRDWHLPVDEFQDAFAVVKSLLAFSIKYHKRPPSQYFYSPIMRCCRLIERIWTKVEAHEGSSNSDQLYALLASQNIVPIIFVVLGKFKLMADAESKANLKAYDVDSVVEFVTNLFKYQTRKLLAPPALTQADQLQMFRQLLVPPDPVRMHENIELRLVQSKRHLTHQLSHPVSTG